VSPVSSPRALTLEEAERYLLSLELFGMHFGLERMQAMLELLGRPQEQFRSVHVVGSNGKSSTTRMIAALLSAHGLRAGSYLSPHLVAFTERVRVEGKDVAADRFAAAVAAARTAAVQVDATRPPDDRVTQFEALTAAALTELARQHVEVAVIEAGLGGRWDATNVLPSSVQVLTNVGLEHTRWLGDTYAAIAREKVDVVRPGGTLVLGPALHPDARAVAEEVATERGARLIVAPAEPPPGLRLRAAGAFQRTNFALACAAAEAFLERPLDPEAVAGAAASTLVPGRFETVGEAPLTILDGAHNPEGFVALTAALGEILDGRRLVAVLSVLDDKDASAMLAELLPLCAEAVATANANPRTLAPEALQAVAAELGRPVLRTEPDPRRALALARELAGPDGVALATGSLYLLADLKRPAGAGPGSTL
jgi:dihydrofolate synthase / folylpolyglutamate synthase